MIFLGENPTTNRKLYYEWRKKHRENKELERAARKNLLDVNIDDVKAEHEESGNLYVEIANACELYGIYEDLFDSAYFTPTLNLNVEYDFDQELVTPVYRGNVIKPKEAVTVPNVTYESDENSMWTLLMTNPDGHFTDNSAEYIHWMVTNIKSSDVKNGKEIVPYMPPFPPFGTGFHRFVFILFKQV